MNDDSQNCSSGLTVENRPQGDCCQPQMQQEEHSGGEALQEGRAEVCLSTDKEAVCPSYAAPMAGFRLFPFVTGWLDTSVGKVPRVRSRLDWADRRGHWAVRWGFGRNSYAVTPGLYAVGQPDGDSPLLVSANYKLSFDCLRSALRGVSVWILVIDTRGINVWCAAGKGTFGTAELVRSCRRSQLPHLLNHRRMIVPQLGAPGIAAFEVKRETGFQVVYGPVRAADLKSFLAAGMQATAPMRRVTFTTWERLLLTPVEVTLMYRKVLIALLVLFVLGGVGPGIFSFDAAWQRGLAAAGAALAGMLSGCVLTPVLLPWIPARAFAAKGALLGLATATVLVLGPYRAAGLVEWGGLYLVVMTVSSYTAMMFTGSTTFTSPSGVSREMRFAIPCQIAAIAVAALAWVGSAFN